MTTTEEIAGPEWVQLDTHCRQTGETPNQVNHRIASGAWLENVHYRRDASGKTWISPVRFNGWVEGEKFSVPPPQAGTTTPSAALYRCFNSAGALLYVGISIRVLVRLGEHISGSHWTGSITRVDIERHPSREEALIAERRAIEKEKPAHNILHAGKAPWRV